MTVPAQKVSQTTVNKPHLLRSATCGLLVVDVQEKLMPFIPRRQELVRNVRYLLEAAKALQIPAQATEQYPKGLGPTVPELASYFAERPDKVAFSCCEIPGLAERFQVAHRTKVLVVGIETHVCVLQTVLDLLAEGLEVFVATDAVASRYQHDHDVALRRMEKAGAILTTTETSLFEWVGQAGTPEFKIISKLVQERMQAIAQEAAR